MTDSAISGRWIAAEFRENCLNAWLMTGTSAEQHCNTQVPAADLQTALDAQSRDWGAAADVPVLLSGSPDAALETVPAKAAGQAVAAASPLLLPGLRQASPCGLMRSARIRLAGFLAQNPDWDGVVCLPGQTTHWVLVSAEEAVSFQSFTTAAQARAGAADMALGGAGIADGGSDLADSVSDLISRPERLASRLAELKAAQELGQMTAAQAHARLWGCWLGAELSAARPYWLGQNLALIADGELADFYSAALESQGLQAHSCGGQAMALAGLTAAWEKRNP